MSRWDKGSRGLVTGCPVIGCAALFAVLAGGAMVGCGDSTSGSGGTGGAGGTGGTGGMSGCPNDLPDTCPSPEPGYSQDVAPILEARCVTCHSAGGQAADKVLDAYGDVYSLRTSILTRVYACKMPPAAAPQLTGEERAALLGWLVCGAKAN